MYKEIMKQKGQKIIVYEKTQKEKKQMFDKDSMGMFKTNAVEA